MFILLRDFYTIWLLHSLTCLQAWFILFDPAVVFGSSWVISIVLNAQLTPSVLSQFWKEVVEDAEVRELIWDKNSSAQGKRICCDKQQKAIKRYTCVYSPHCMHWHMKCCNTLKIADCVYGDLLFSCSFVPESEMKWSCHFLSVPTFHLFSI